MANSSSRSGARVLWVVVHTAEGIRKASDLKAFFERSTNSSSHAVADDVTLLDNLVPYDRAAWTLRNGNSRSDNLELCGFANWSRAEWLNNHQGMLNNAAAWIRSRCLSRGIPIHKIDAAAVGRNEAGVIGHVDYTNGKHDGSHWDPGPGFPWDVVIARAAQGGAAPIPEEDMPLSGNDFKYLMYDNPIQEYGNLSQLLQEIKDKARTVSGLSASVTALTKIVVDNEKNDITSASLAAALNGVITAQIGPIVRDQVTAALGDANSDEASKIAEAVLTKLGEKITQPSA
jgi:hypothetical protein